MKRAKAQRRGSRDHQNSKKVITKAARTVFERLEERRLLSGAPAQVWVDNDWTFAPGGDVGNPGLSSGDTVQESGGVTHTYGQDAFSTIQDGVNFVNDGGVVIVLDGTYTERVAIGRPVTINGQSASGAIAQADSSGPVDGHDAFDINAPGASVSIHQLVIRNSDWGIRSTAGNVSVTNSTFSNNGYDGSTFGGASAADAATFFAAHATNGGAIWIVDSTGNEIASNVINSNDQGIVLTHATATHIHDNSVTSNARRGIGLFDGSNNFVDNNSITSNGGEGLLLSGESSTSATGNTASSNANAGIVLFNAKEISVSNSQVNSNNSRSFSGDGSTNQWPAGIYATGAGAAGGTFTLHLDNNSISSNGTGGNSEGSIGLYLGSSLRADGIIVTGSAASPPNIATQTIGLRSSASNVSISNLKINKSSTAMLIDGGVNVSIDNVNFDGGSDPNSSATDLKITSAAGSINSLTNTKFRITNVITSRYVVSLRGQEINAINDSFVLPGGTPAVTVTGATANSSQLTTLENRIDHGLDSGSAGVIPAGFIRFKAGNVYVTTASGSIQRGIDVASAGDTINVPAAPFTESLSIDKSVTVLGQGDTTLLKAPVAIPTRFTTSADNHPIVFVTGGAKPTIKLIKIDGQGNGSGNARFEGIAFHNAGGVVDHVTLTGILKNPLDAQSGVGIYTDTTDGVARGLTISNNIINSSNIGIASFQSSGTVIDGNDVSGSDDTGILLWGGDATVNNNNIHDNSGDGLRVQQGNFGVTNNNIHLNTGNGLKILGDGDPAVFSPISASISNNFITGNHLDGIFVDASVDGAAGIVVHHNDIRNDSDGGLDNESSERIDASENWWGSPNGPTHPDNHYNVGSQGSVNTGPQNFAPWLLDGTDQDLALPGFQPSSAIFSPPTLPITNDSGGAFSTIQSAIDGTAAGGTITIADGIYNESNIHVNKPLTIQGQSKAGAILGPSMADGHLDSSFDSASNAFIIESADVTIRNMTIDGNQDGAIVGDHNFRSAVVAESAAGSYDGITLEDLAIQHIYRDGVRLSTPGEKSTDETIQRNTIDDVSIGDAISLENADVDVQDNVLSHVLTGLRAHGGTPLAGSVLHIAGNSFSSPLAVPGGIGGRAMDLANLGDGSTITGNTINMTGGNKDIGLLISSSSGQAGVSVSGNTIATDSDDEAIVLFEEGDPDHPLVIDNNTISGTDSADAIVITEDASIFGGAAHVGPSHAVVLDNQITGFARGVVVTAIDHLGSAKIGDVGHGNTIDGPGYGVFISGATATVTGNIIDCNDTGYFGANVQDGGVASISNNSFAHCSDGVHIDAHGTASVDFNTFSDNATDLDLSDITSNVTSVTHNAFNVSPNPDSQVIINFSPVDIDATTDTFSGKLGSDMTLPEAFAAEDSIWHALDQSGLGFVKLQSGFIYATQSSGSVQRGIDVAAGGETVEIQNGTYPQNLTIPVPITLQGQSQDGVILLPNLIGADTGGGSLGAGASSVILVQNNQVKIHNLTVDGDNPFLTSGIVRNGADIDARNGIITDHTLGPVFNDLQVDHVTVKNIYLRGIYASSGGTFTFTNNTVDNVAGDGSSVAIFNFGGSGLMSGNTVSRANDAISANHSRGTQFLNNIVTDSGSGVHTDNAGDGGGPGDVISGNIVSNGSIPNGSYGVWVLVPYLTVTVSNNTVTNFDVGLGAFGSQALGVVNFTGNTVSAPARPGAIGAQVTNDTFGFGDMNIAANFTDNNNISNTDTGILVQQNPGSTTNVVITGNSSSIHGNHIGIDAAGGLITITDNRLYDNDIAIRVSGGASAEITGNLFRGPEAGGFQGPDNRVDVDIEADAGLISPMHGNSFGGDNWFIQNHSSQNIDATGNLFDAASNFEVEDKTLHKMDDDSLGLVSWVANNLYVTDAGTDHSIQHAIDIASWGNVINVEAGIYEENLVIDKSLTLNGANAGIAADSAARGAETQVKIHGVVVTAIDTYGNLTINGFQLDGDVGVNAVSSSSGVAIPKFLDISNAKISATGNGIVVADLDGDLLLDSNVISTGGTGIDVSGNALRATKTRSNIQNNRLQSGGVGILISGTGADLSITNNDVTSSGPLVDAVLVNGAGKNTPVTRSNISNNRLTAPGRGLVCVDLDGDLILDDNTITTGAGGIDISGSAGRITKSRSNIQNNRLVSGGVGVLVSGIDADSTIAGNDIASTESDPFNDAMQLTNIGKNTPVTRSNISNNRVTTPGRGVVAVDVDGDLILDGNTITTGTGGIVISGSALRATKTRSNIQNNRLQSGGIGALVTDIDADVSFSGNTINAGDTGVHIERIDGDVSVEQDTVTSASHGFFLDTLKGKATYKNSRITFGGGGGGGAVGIQTGNVDNDIDIINNDVLSVSAGDIGIYIPNQTTNVTRATKSRSNVQNNRVQTPGLGVWLENLDADADISGNTLTNNGGGAVGNTNYIGIHSIAAGGDTLSINNNTINAGKARALVMVDTSGSLAADGNTITAGISGIEISGSDGQNTIGGTAGNDITVDGGFGTGVLVSAMTHGTVKFFNNRISSDFNGISLEDVDADVEVSGNHFDCASTGLNLQRIGGDVLIHGDDFAGRSPTPADPGNGFGIQASVINGNVVIGTLADGNTFHDLTAGILLDTADGVSIANNSFDHLLAMAASITDGTSAQISGNTVTDADSGFVVNSHSSPSDLSITSNTIKLAHTGYLLDGNDAPLNITLGAGNSIQDGADGIVISGEHASLGGNSLADLDLDRLSDRFVALLDNALQGDRIDATQVTFNGSLASALSIDQNFAIEDKITHATDDSSVGFIRFVPHTVFVTQSSGSIQRGVDAGEDGDTVNVNQGSYDGGVIVSKRVLRGSGDVDTTGHLNPAFKAIGSDVTIDHFNLVGDPTSSQRYGILLSDGGDNFSIMNSHTSGFDTAIIVAQAPLGTHHLLISNNTLDVLPTGTAIELHSVSDAVIEENELGFGRDMIVITGGSDVSISRNIFHGGSTAIVVAGSNSLSSAGNTFFDGGTAISIDQSVDVAFTHNVVANAGDDAIIVSGSSGVSITQNEINVAAGRTWTRVRAGIAGNGGGATDVSGNIFSGQPDIGMVLEAGFAGALHMHINSITGAATAALENDSSVVVDATGNWWGSPNGPTSSLNTWAGTPKGDKVLGSNVVFAPWLIDGIDADPALRGFQHAGPDTIAPAVSAPDLDAASDSGASDHDDITRINTPTFTGTAEPGATIDLMEGATVLGTTSVDALGNWTITSSILPDGAHDLLARATDMSGNTSSSATLTVSIDTASPLVNAGTDQTVNEADPVTLAATFDDGAGFGAYTFHWTQSEGPFVFTTQTGNILNFTPPDDGFYTFTVTVTDAAGNTGSDSVSVTARNVNPVITAVNLDHTTIDENGDVTVTGSFTDPGTLDKYKVNVAWDDGSESAAVVDEATRTFTATHRYLDDNPSGTSSDQYTISVTVTDDDQGTSAAVTRTITVNNVAPHATINGAPSTGLEGTQISLTSTIFDPGTLDTFTYAWAVTKNGAVYTSSSAPSFSFTPDDDATYIVSLTVTDDDGGIGFDSKTITITDVDPIISLSGDAHTNEGATYTLTLGAITDPGADTVIRWYVNWGDSSPLDIYTSGGNKTHVYADGPATRSIVVSLEDENGIHANAGSFTVNVDDVAPTATFGNLGSASEGSGGFVIFSAASDPSGDDQSAGFRYSFDFNNDGVFEIGNGTYAFGTISPSAPVPAAYLADGPGTRTVRGRISDRDGGFNDYLTTITINNVAPIVNAGPDTSIGTNSFLTQSASFTDPGADAPWQVYVNYTYDPITNPGLGTLSQSGPAKTFVLSHFYSAAGTYTARVTVIDKDGASGFDDVVVTVANNRFQVSSFTPTVSGFDVRFNRAVDTSKVNLYDGLDASIDPPDVTFFGAATGPVQGSLVWDFQGNILHFVKTGGPLPTDNYSVTLQSRLDGFTDAGGELLDGNFDNVAGGDYSTTFAVNPTTDRLLSIPDFARGPGQAVNVPTTGIGIPIHIDNSSGINAVDLDVIYDGFQLAITGATLAPGMPADWSITTNLVTNGIFKITISGVSTLSGARDLIILNANVPSSTPYGGSGVVRMQNVSINGGFIGSRADTAVHKVAFLGDVSGNGSLDGFDSALISRVVVALDSGFDHASMTDPLIVADVNANGAIDGLDASWVAQKSLFAPSRPEIPNIPAGPIGSFAGYDPTFALPDNAPASAGGTSIVSLAVTDSANGLIGFNVNVGYVTTLLDVADGFASSDVTMGSLFSSAGGWTLISYVDDASGSIGMSFFRTTPMTGGTGSIADLHFHLPASDAPTVTPVDVSGAAGSETGLLYTYDDGSIAIGATPTISGTAGNDSFYVRKNGANVEIYSGTSASGALVFSAALTSLASLNFDTGAGNDNVIVDLTNGSPLPPGGISYNGGTDSDSLTVIGAGSGAVSYKPSSTEGSGTLALSANAIAFAGVEPITTSGFTSISIVTPSASDTLLIDKAAAGQNRLSGFSGSTALSPLTFFNISQVLIDTATNDGGAGDDSITISDGMVASGLASLSINAGTGLNTLTALGGTTPLIAINGQSLNVTADGSAVVNLLASQSLQSLILADTARANLSSGGKHLSLGGLVIDSNANLDITDGQLDIAPADAAMFTTIRSYIRNARNSQGILWTGNGLGSSYVAANSSTLAVASVFNGSTIHIEPALIGDLNLDHQVSINDFLELASHFNTNGPWAAGDLNYDDNITISDFLDLSSHFNQTYSPPSAAPVFAAASESIAAAPASANSDTTSSPSNGKKRTHSRRVVRHHRPGTARPGISRHE